MEHKPALRKEFGRRMFKAFGPGVVTGAADDDPSGIATYSIAGAQLGTHLLWTAVMNGVLAPFLLVGILSIATDKILMRGQPSSRLSIFVVGLTTLLMFVAAIGMWCV